MEIIVDGRLAALKKYSPFEFVSENRFFTDAAPLYPLHRVSASVATMQYVADVIGSLKQRLDEPFVTVNSVTGELGIKQAQDEYARLIRNKTPKSRR